MYGEKLNAIKAFPTGAGLASLFDAGYRIMGYPILMHDMNYKLTAFSRGVETDDPIWNEYVSTGTVSKKTLEFFRDASFIEAAANTKSIAILRTKRLNYDRIYGKLFSAEHIQIGCACMVGTHPMQKEDAVLFECFCEKVNSELALLDSFTEHGRRYQDYLIAQLIEGNIADRLIYGAHVESLYIGLKGNLYLAVADIKKAASTNSKAAALALKTLTDLFRQSFPQHKYSIYRNQILALFSDEAADKRVISRTLQHFLDEHDICLGISVSFENLFELDRYYHQARSALTKCLQAKKTSDCNRAVFYTE